MSRRYIDNIKGLIEKEVSQRDSGIKVTMEFISAAYAKIVPKIRILEELIWEVPPVDEQTLASFYETAKREYISINPIKIDPASALTKAGFKTWLTKDRIASTRWNYTDRYIRYLEEMERPKEVIRETERSSLEIVSNLGDPASSTEFFVRGLVVGEVQSGKTANFNAVINRAIDCGYKLIIVLSGIMEDLRGQTQNRTELEVVGWGALPDSDQIGNKGVGEKFRFGMQGDASVQQIESITSRDTDFSIAMLKGQSALNSPKILICKKNVSILRNLINWLGGLLEAEGDQHAVPLLVLDDEADNASLNNEGKKGREYASKINGHLRALLHLFQRKSYLGYTASPFANVLQDRNDAPETRWPVRSAAGERQFAQVDNLFPDDFIILLRPPSNYVGAKRIFETLAEGPKLPLVSAVHDYADEFPTRLLKSNATPVRDFPTKDDWDAEIGPGSRYLDFQTYVEYRRATRAARRDDPFPESLPRSLMEAIQSFVLAIAVRESRIPAQKQSRLFQPHNTMLVHISRFTTWQNKTVELIKDYVDGLKARIENDRPDEDRSIFFELEDVWNRYFADIIANVREYLPDGYEDPFMAPVVFEAVKRFVPTAIKEIDTLGINSDTGHKLVYPKRQPRKIIAVGGNRLSRGFTVEGLTINYFIRTTNYSDTLLQMGRWFGYRPGYIDCCRIFTSRDSIEKFNSTTRCIEELEAEFTKMEDRGKSPSNFLLRVRKHPGVLKITRPSILKNTKTVKWSFQDQLEMTTKFDVSKKKIESVWNSFKNNVAPLFHGSGSHDSQFFKRELPADEFLNLLRSENNFEDSSLQAMISFIELCQSNGKLTDWTIAVKRTGGSKRVLQPEQSGLPDITGMVIRNGPRSTNDEHRDLFLKNLEFRASGRSANIVSSPRDLAISLSANEVKNAERTFRDEREALLIAKGMPAAEARQRALKVTIPESVYREKIPDHRGVLIIYLFDSHYSFNQEPKDRDVEFRNLVERDQYDLNMPIVGYAIGFPPIDPDPGGTYAHGDYDLEFDEADDENAELVDSSVPDDATLESE